MADYMRGLITRGSRNVWTVRTLELPPRLFECRIKGKVLKSETNFYNPLAPGDIVQFEEDAGNSGCGMIFDVDARRTVFKRFNAKGRAAQLLACNVDMVVCVTSPAAPPFRPRFIDRVLAQAESSGILSLIVVNKSDLLPLPDATVRERLDDYIRIGYTVLYVSAKNGAGVDTLKLMLQNRFSVFVGQSGVGKSSLTNALFPNIKQKIGALNEKYDRGNHTTVLPELFEQDGIAIADIPGVRQLAPDGIDAVELAQCFKEFAPLALHCAFGLSCTHTSEAGCKITAGVEQGAIHPDRYESFMRIKNELLKREKYQC
jgi:ribosome biogenesis GTPase